ncbi:MAG: SRPBCC domain-containing protein [Pseudolysinimonas sp.]
MTDPSYTTTFTTDRTPLEAFDAINDVRSWWTGDIEGDSRRLGDAFTYRHQDIHRSTQRVIESVPGERVVWRVENSFLNFTADPAEWDGTQIVFEITPAGDGAQVRFTHEGLRPSVECFDACSSAWSHYVGESLRAFISSREVPAAS